MSRSTIRPWLVWAAPLLLTVVAVVGIRAAGSTEAGPRPPVGVATETTPTTGFAQRVPVLPAEPFSYAAVLPVHVEADFAQFDSTPAGDPVTDEGATLGRVLFYDVNLSRNRTVRCASCHSQAHSFTDPLVLSQGFSGLRTRRNSMPLANAVLNASGRFLWDEKAETLEHQVLMPFVDDREMGMTATELRSRVEEQPYYGSLFSAAFGDDAVTLERIASALAQFIRSMVSVASRYDEGRATVDDPVAPFTNFSDAENRGKELFFTSIDDGGGGCASCHSSEVQIFGADGLRNNGIDPPTTAFEAFDLGSFEITGDPGDTGRFRVPSLRNIEVTAPYMHDGRFASLEAVIDHYRSGIQAHENLSPELRTTDGSPVRLDLSDDDSGALVAFLKTLTDRSFLTDERFSEPFRG